MCLCGEAPMVPEVTAGSLEHHLSGPSPWNPPRRWGRSEVLRPPSCWLRRAVESLGCSGSRVGLLWQHPSQRRAKVAASGLVGRSAGVRQGDPLHRPSPLSGAPPSQMGDLHCGCKQPLSLSLSSTCISNGTGGEVRWRALWLSSNGQRFTSTHSSPPLLHQLVAELTV